MEKFLNELLAKFGSASKDCVCLSVTPDLGLEIIKVDPKLRSVEAYACKPLAYNETRREIENYEQFKAVFEDLTKEIGVSTKCSVALNLPTVMIDKMDLALLLSDENVLGALTSAAEQSYLFKRSDPMISWFDASVNSASDTRKIFYSAVQKTAIDNIKSVLEGMGASLVSVETSLTSYLRALDYSGLAEAEMQEGVSWNLMIVNPMGYSIIAMQGKKIVDSYEEPIALKTYEAEEVYDAISQSAQISLMSFPATNMCIISETDLVSAELLSAKIPFDGKINFVENNSYRKKDYLPVSLNVLPNDAAKISLAAIGVGVSRIHPYPVKLDFIASGDVEAKTEEIPDFTFTMGGKEYTLTEATMRIIAVAIIAVIAVPLLIALMILPKIQNSKQAALDMETAKVNSIEADIKKFKDEASNTGFVVKTEIENVLKSNRSKLMAYSALGSSVPRDLWITYFTTDSQGKIDIKGSSENVEDVYIFFKNMRDSLVDAQMRLRTLEMSSSLEDAVEIGETYYNFEITNMTEGELNPETASEEGSGNKANNNSKDGDNSGKNATAKPKSQPQSATSGNKPSAQATKLDEVLPELDMN